MMQKKWMVWNVLGPFNWGLNVVCLTLDIWKIVRCSFKSFEQCILQPLKYRNGHDLS